MNAVTHMAVRMPGAVARRLATRREGRFAAGQPTLLREPQRPRSSVFTALSTDEAREQVATHWSSNLCGLLNAMTRGELAALADALRLPAAPVRSPDLRMALWELGAAVERGDAPVASQSNWPVLQPRPVLLGGHLVVQARPRGMHPPSASWPRAVPHATAATPPAEEPDSLDDLLAAADRAIGVRLGPRGADKGAWGMRAASLLGVVERGHDEPDWRGDVEVKTLPVARERAGHWRVVEDPAIAMIGLRVAAKLQRTLWLARTNLDHGDATIVSWYLLDWDAEVARLSRRYLHERPKGPAGTDGRAMYLNKSFFADAGLLASLNGWS